MLENPDERVPLSALADVWRELRARHPDPALGFELARRIDLTSLGLVGYGMKFSRTLGDALGVLGRYYRILREGIECRIERDAAGATVVFSEPETAGERGRQEVDARLAGLLMACRQVTGRRIVPAAVAFPYRQPSGIDEHRRTFGTRHLRFAEPHASLTVRTVDLVRPLPAADDTLAAYLDRLAADTLRQLGSPVTGSLAAAVAQALRTIIRDAPPTIDAVGTLLGMSARTLQRRLQTEGTTFAKLRQELRRQHAELLLHEGRLTVEEIAIRIGYSEPSTFYRAFRRWRGTSPAAFRIRISR